MPISLVALNAVFGGVSSTQDQECPIFCCHGHLFKNYVLGLFIGNVTQLIKVVQMYN
jgi:hypothetical protein